MNLIKNGTIALAFLLEICAIFILGYWGFNLQINKAIRVIVGLLVPISMIVVWGILCAPSSSYRLEGFWLLLIKCFLFGLVTYCLFSMNSTTLAIIFGLSVMVNLGLSIYFGTL